MTNRYFSGHRIAPDPLEQYLPDPDQLEFDDVFQITVDAAKVEAGAFALPVHRCMYDFWLANKKGQDLPLSAAIDPLSFWKAVGFVHVIQPNDDGSDFMYRLFATGVSDIGGRDMTGKWFSESPVSSWNFYRRQLAACMALRQPIYSENNAAYDVSVTIKWCRLLLPMVDAQGAVNRILVPNVPVDRTGNA